MRRLRVPSADAAPARWRAPPIPRGRTCAACPTSSVRGTRSRSPTGIASRWRALPASPFGNRTPGTTADARVCYACRDDHPTGSTTFLATSAAAFVGAGLAPASAAPARRRLALAGTWLARLQHVGPGARPGPRRSGRARGAVRLQWPPRTGRTADDPRGTTAPVFADFDGMLRDARPDAVIVATVDATHAQYVVRALDLGFDVYSEKPLCTTEEQCQSILDAARRSGKVVTATMNARHAPEAKKVKALLQEQAIGDVLSVDFHEYLEHEPRRRLLPALARFRATRAPCCRPHKASHHFDLANWWGRRWTPSRYRPPVTCACTGRTICTAARTAAPARTRASARSRGTSRRTTPT